LCGYTFGFWGILHGAPQPVNFPDPPGAGDAPDRHQIRGFI